MTDTYHQQVVQQLAQARAELAQLHEGEEEYTDERLVPTPGQWIWLWNQATPEKRLEVAGRAISQGETAYQCVMAHKGLREHLADEHRTSAARAAEADRLRQLLRKAEDELAVHRQRAAGRPVETRHLVEIHREGVRVHGDGELTGAGPEALAALLAEGAPAEPVPTASYIPTVVPACPHCHRRVHAGITCQETAALAEALEQAIDKALQRVKEPHLGAAFTETPATPSSWTPDRTETGPRSATLHVSVPAQVDSANYLLPTSSHQSSSCPDPIECGHEAALGLAENRLAMVRMVIDGAGAAYDGERLLIHEIRQALEATP